MSRRGVRVFGLISIVAFVSLAITSVLAWSSPQRDAGSSLPIDSQAASSAPDFQVDLYQGGSLAEGSTWRLSNHLGNTVLVNFWAVSCPPCRAEMPSLERTYTRFKDQGFIVIGVDVGASDPKELRQEGLEFLQELGITFPSGPSKSSQIIADYQVTGIPTSVLVKPDGKIYAKWAGVLDEGEVIGLVEKALAR